MTILAAITYELGNGFYSKPPQEGYESYRDGVDVTYINQKLNIPDGWSDYTVEWDILKLQDRIDRNPDHYGFDYRQRAIVRDSALYDGGEGLGFYEVYVDEAGNYNLSVNFSNIDAFEDFDEDRSETGRITNTIRYTVTNNSSLETQNGSISFSQSGKSICARSV